MFKFAGAPQMAQNGINGGYYRNRFVPRRSVHRASQNVLKMNISDSDSVEENQDFKVEG